MAGVRARSNAPMRNIQPSPLRSRRRRPRRAHVAVIVLLAAFVYAAGGAAAAHPLGNFSINHFARVETGAQGVRVRYVVDMAEIPTFQESQVMDANADGELSEAEMDAYLRRVVPQYADKLVVTVDGARVPLRAVAQTISTSKGASGLPVLRIECALEGELPVEGGAAVSHHVRFENQNLAERLGWREIVAAPAAGASVFDSTAFGSTATDELREYPQDMLSAPLDERAAEWSWSPGEAPNGATPLRTREGRSVGRERDLLAELIAVPEVTLPVALFGLLFAAGLGALHAFSPGHGKTVVGAYLVGSRGTAGHAAFLGLTVTVTHTAGVFALGLVTLFASQYVVPERLFPVLSFVSGAIVVAIGLSLFVRRLLAALPGGSAALHAHTHHHHAGGHTHEHGQEDDHQHHLHHDGDESSLVHSHGGREHSHLPPGTDGTPVTWRSLLALGVSGGLLPCPSALVVLLAAIALGRVGYGLALVVAFSVGLAATLTAIGFAFVYAGRLMSRTKIGESRLVRVLPIISAFVIACVGAAICYEALSQAGIHVSALFSGFAAHGAAAAPSGGATDGGPSLAPLGAFAVLGLGLLFGLKHATEADHIVAVSTIVTGQRNVMRAALVGGLWGVGHTASLVVVGVVVLALRIAIPERVAGWLEFGVAVMIIGLGVNVLVRAMRGRADIHLHRHSHDGTTHAHLHFHEDEAAREHPPSPDAHSHAVSRVGLKPFLVGAMHGLAGSATLTLLVLTQIESVFIGLLYLAVFGLGSIVGMLLMSSLVGLPFAFSARQLPRFNHGLQAMAGVLSIAFGLWYAYETGMVSGL